MKPLKPRRFIVGLAAAFSCAFAGEVQGQQKSAPKKAPKTEAQIAFEKDSVEAQKAYFSDLRICRMDRDFGLTELNNRRRVDREGRNGLPREAVGSNVSWEKQRSDIEQKFAGCTRLAAQDRDREVRGARLRHMADGLKADLKPGKK